MYTANNYKSLIGLKGFSEQALKIHFALYEGYVKNTNQLLEKIEALRHSGEESTQQFAELKRRLGWEFNGLRLHEYYFSVMSKEAGQLDNKSALAEKLSTDFGSLEEWEKDFRATALQRGIGWVILTYDSIGKKLINIWVNEHDVGHLAGTEPLLPIDVFEHAFLIDYGIKKSDYVDAFFGAINWSEVNRRFESVN